MNVAIWPSSLPRPLRDSWQSQDDDNRLVRASEGPPGYRRRFSTRVRRVAMAIVLTRRGKVAFDNFYHTVTRDGSLPFYMPDPTTEGWPLLTGAGAALTDASGRPILLSARWLCVFGADTPVETVRGVAFEIAFGVVVLP